MRFSRGFCLRTFGRLAGLTCSFSVILILESTRTNALAGQAVIESVNPPGGDIQVLRLGSNAADSVTAGSDLLPGDLLIGTRVQVGVRCPVDDGPVFVFSDGFRLMIDVPNDSGCTVDLLAGTVNVITDEPTEVHAGGVTLGSQGTTYSASVRRNREVSLSVFEGTVVASSDQLQSTPTEAGRTLVWNPGTVTAIHSMNSAATLRRASTAFATYDAVQAAGTTQNAPDLRTLAREFQNLYLQVLSNASDTTSRIDLARTQATYSLNDKAIYNLRQAAVNDTAEIRRYNIDPERLRRGLSNKYEAYYESNLTTRYVGGVISRQGTVIRPADLTVEATGPTTARRGQDVGSLLTITVRNVGGQTAAGTNSGAKGYMIDLVLSPDSELNTGYSVYAAEYRRNVLLRGGRYSNTADVRPGETWSPGRSSATIPADTPPGRYCLGIVVDAGRAINEANENNNTACVWIRITG